MDHECSLMVLYLDWSWADVLFQPTVCGEQEECCLCAVNWTGSCDSGPASAWTRPWHFNSEEWSTESFFGNETLMTKAGVILPPANMLMREPEKKNCMEKKVHCYKYSGGYRSCSVSEFWTCVLVKMFCRSELDCTRIISCSVLLEIIGKMYMCMCTWMVEIFLLQYKKKGRK